MAEIIEIEDSLEAFAERAEREGWGDGLPLVPPTPERVQAAVARAGRAPGDVVAALPPQMGPATVEKIAVNAVMAGCRPEYLPVVIAAVEAVASPRFNLQALQVTTGPVGPLLVVNGPIRHTLGINAGYGALGPGWRANATIGRALRLVLINIGGGRPGDLDMATLGQPGKYTACLAEHEERNPWMPLHVERGFRPSASTVTVFGAEAPINVNDVASRSARAVLRAIATNMQIIGCSLYFKTEPLVVLSPEHAALLATEGWTKDAVRRHLFETAGLPISHLSADDVEERLARRWPRKYAHRGPDTRVTIADSPDDIVIIVAGGGGRHSTYIPPGGMTRSVTVEIPS